MSKPLQNPNDLPLLNKVDELMNKQNSLILS